MQTNWEKIQKSSRRTIQIQRYNLRFVLMHLCTFNSNLSSPNITLKVCMVAQNDMRWLKALGNVKGVGKGLNWNRLRSTNPLAIDWGLWGCSYPLLNQMLSAIGFPKHGLKWHAEIKKSQSDTGQVANSKKDIEVTKMIMLKKWESVHYISRQVCEIILEASTLILTATSGRGLKKDFGGLRRKQEEQLDEYPSKPLGDPATLTSYKEQKTWSVLRTFLLVWSWTFALVE